MGRTGITYHDVSNAIATLQGQQRNPTVDNIRDVLETGSKSTIAKFLREWKAKNKIKNIDESGMPLEILQLIRGLWEKLQEDADTEILKYKETVDAKINEAQKAYLQKKQAHTLLQSEYHDLEEKAQQQTTTIQSLQEQLATQQNENTKCIERIGALSNKNDENKAENERLHQLLKNTQDNLTHYQKAVQEQRQEQTLLLEKQRNEYEQKIMQLQNQCGEAKNQCLQLESQNTQLVESKETLSFEYNTLIEKHTELSQSHDKLSAKHNQLKEFHDTLTQQCNKQSKLLDSKTEEVIDLKIQLKSTENKVTDLEKSLSNADNKTRSLRHERDIARQEKAHIEGQLQQMQFS